MTPPTDDHSIAFPCPHCGTEIQKTIGWLLRHDHIGCGCGAQFGLNTSALQADLAAARGAAEPSGQAGSAAA